MKTSIYLVNVNYICFFTDFLISMVPAQFCVHGDLDELPVPRPHAFQQHLQKEETKMGCFE